MSKIDLALYIFPLFNGICVITYRICLSCTCLYPVKLVQSWLTDTSNSVSLKECRHFKILIWGQQHFHEMISNVRHKLLLFHSIYAIYVMYLKEKHSVLIGSLTLD